MRWIHALNKRGGIIINHHKSPYALEIENLTVKFCSRDHTVHAVNGLNLKIQRGQTLGLVGETGAGKTTTCLAILNLIPSPPGIITNGNIAVNGSYVFKTDSVHNSRAKLCMTEKELQRMRGKTVSMIFQDPMTSLNPVLTVERQISEVIEKHENASLSEAIQKAREMLELVGIPSERGKEYPHQFSGGMKQRVVIAMALACNPDLLIADEPTTALDVTIQAQVLDMIKKLRERNGTSMLMITHDLGIVAETCDCVSVVYAGRIVEHGTLEDVFEHTLHPYTKGLFNSLPNMKDRKARLNPIPGLMPDPSIIPTGCAFADRCQYALPICCTEQPPVLHRTNEHLVTCHLYSKDTIQKGGAFDE